MCNCGKPATVIEPAQADQAAAGAADRVTAEPAPAAPVDDVAPANR